MIQFDHEKHNAATGVPISLIITAPAFCKAEVTSLVLEFTHIFRLAG